MTEKDLRLEYKQATGFSAINPANPSHFEYGDIPDILLYTAWLENQILVERIRTIRGNECKIVTP